MKLIPFIAATLLVSILWGTSLSNSGVDAERIISEAHRVAMDDHIGLPALGRTSYIELTRDELDEPAGTNSTQGNNQQSEEQILSSPSSELERSLRRDLPQGIITRFPTKRPTKMPTNLPMERFDTLLATSITRLPTKLPTKRPTLTSFQVSALENNM